MARKLRYRTYIINLWLATMFCAPFAFLLFTLLVDARMYNDPAEPLLFALFLFIASIFTVPTVLFVIIASMVIPKISKRPSVMKRATIISVIAGIVGTFLLVLGASNYSEEQMMWGITSTFIYVASGVGFGWRLKI